MNTRRRPQFRSYDLYQKTGFLGGTILPSMVSGIIRDINPVLDRHQHLGAHDTEPETFIAQILIESIEDRLGIKLTDQITVGQLRGVM